MSAADSDPVIEYRNASYRLGNGRALLQQVNLTVRRGGLLAILGRSGSGKTTALKLINTWRSAGFPWSAASKQDDVGVCAFVVYQGWALLTPA
jgi:ABC-type nitrate/sulfonate/bicarbonate transport system ATPase subunit